MESSDEFDENSVAEESRHDRHDAQSHGERCTEQVVEESTPSVAGYSNAASERTETTKRTHDEICILCDKPMAGSDKTCVIKKRGIETLIQASKKRRDKKDDALKNFVEIKVHQVCRVIYPRDSNIKAALEVSKKSWHQSRDCMEEGRCFDFSTKCFFCSNGFKSTSATRRLSKQLTVDSILEQLKLYPDSESNKIIYARLNCLKDSDDEYYVTNKVYYHATCQSKFYSYNANNAKGAPISEGMSSVVSFIINHIVENSDECQFSMKDILQKYTKIHGNSDYPRLHRIESHLLEHFGEEIVVYTTNNDRLICFKRTLGQCIEDSWYVKRNDNEREEKKRIVELAAHIILQDVRAMKFDLTKYNSPSEFLNNVNSDIPETLQLFLDLLIKTHKRKPKNGSMRKWDNRISTFAHVLMSSVRPRSFCSPILLGLSSMMHTRFAARGLIDCLSNIGLSASYSETVRFETSIVHDPESFEIIADTYLQFIYDNADHNTATIDGKNTFHYMGGIMCVTPLASVSCNSKIPRIKGSLPTTNSESTSGFLPLTEYKGDRPFRLDNVKVHDWKGNERLEFSVKLTPIDILYFFGKHADSKSTPNWHGFINKYHAFNSDFCTTKVIALPFIKAPPSDHTTVLTALIDARLRANKNGQKHCFVTFDLPLYMKANEVLASIDPDNDPYNLQSVILRLGGFHLSMSYLGSINTIMAGSGLKEAFCTIYAELSAEKALMGNAFSRSVRGHLLVQAALASIIFRTVELDENEQLLLRNTLKKIDEEDINLYLSDPVMDCIEKKFVSAVEKMEKRGPTAKLWVLYFKLVCLLLRFIDAERSGNFELHIETVTLMIPIFFATGHHLYAKASLLYVQNMLKLKDIMDVIEYDKFCKQGFFTIRRSNRFWSGIWSDMTIEQVLMRAMKCTGGLTHGRGLTESVIAKWVLSRVAVLEVGNAMELFCNVTFSTSEQHVDNRASRISRDDVDLKKLQGFFRSYDPFPETDKIIGIFSGVIGESNVNCHRTYEIGISLMEDTSNKKFTEVKCKKKDKIIHLAAANSTMKNAANEEVYISPLLILQKITLNIETKNDIKEYASTYELAPIPLALFDENGMRKTKKSEFFDNFEYSLTLEHKNKSIVNVLDGGLLLNKVIWPSNIKVNEILSKYVAFVKKNCVPNSYVIFDGYPEDETISTKSVERSRRHCKSIGRDLCFDSNTIIAVSQKLFISNEKNKTRLINMLCQSLNNAGYRTKIAPEDADRLIISTAIDEARIQSDTSVVIIGEDTDLVVLLSQLAHDIDNIYFKRFMKGGKPPQYYNSSSFKYKNLQNIVAFLHAFCGCDTTSCFYNIGKQKLLDSIKPEQLLKLAVPFYDRNSTSNDVANAAFQLIIGMYTKQTDKIIIEKTNNFSLSDLRYLHYSQAKNKKNFALEKLPPTEGAAKQHAMRVYYQVQNWLGNDTLQPTDWGWKIKNDRLLPIGTDNPPIPLKLLNQISCSCSKKGCVDKSCSCKKQGTPCSNLCVHCHEGTCANLDESNKTPSSASDDALGDDCFTDETVNNEELIGNLFANVVEQETLANEAIDCMSMEIENESSDESIESLNPAKRKRASKI